MNPDDLARILDELGRRLGPAGEHVFALAVRQVYIDAAIAMVFLSIPLVVLAATARRVYHWQQDGDSYSDREITTIFYVVGLGVWIGLALLYAFIVVPRLLNPEYAAIQNLLRAIAQ